MPSQVASEIEIKLPPELLIYIFSSLTYYDFNILSLVCKYFNYLITKNEYLWKKEFRNEFPDEFTKACKDQQHTWSEKFINCYKHYEAEYKKLTPRQKALRQCLRKHDADTLEFLKPSYEEIVKFNPCEKALVFYVMQTNDNRISQYIFSVIEAYINEQTNTPTYIPYLLENRINKRKLQLYFYAIYLKQPIPEYVLTVSQQAFYFAVGFIPGTGHCGKAVHVAAFVGNMPYLQELMTQDIRNLDLADDDNLTPLYYAISNNQVAATQFLLSHNAKIEIAKRFSFMPLLHFATKKGNLEIIQALLDAGAEKYLTYLYEEQLPIHVAAFHGHIEVIKLFLKYDATLLELHNQDKNTPLTSAMKGCQASTVTFLLENHANIHGTTNSFHVGLGWIPLKFAITQSTVEVFEILYQASDKKEIELISLLVDAVSNNKIEFVKKILSFDSEIKNQKSSLGLTPLHIAVKSGYYDLVQYLLEQGVDVHATIDSPTNENIHNKSALTIALENNQEKIANLLLKYGAKLLGHEKINTELLSEKMLAKIELMQFIRHCKFDNNTAYRCGWSYKTFFKKVPKEKVLATARKIKHNTFGDKTKSALNDEDRDALTVSKLNNIYQRLL